MIELAHRFGYRVVAEGVETEAASEILTSMQCDVAQGFLFARPMPQEAFIDWLATCDAFWEPERSGSRRQSG